MPTATERAVPVSLSAKCRWKQPDGLVSKKHTNELFHADRHEIHWAETDTECTNHVTKARVISPRSHHVTDTDSARFSGHWHHVTTDTPLPLTSHHHDRHTLLLTSCYHWYYVTANITTSPMTSRHHSVTDLHVTARHWLDITRHIISIRHLFRDVECNCSTGQTDLDGLYSKQPYTRTHQ